MAEAALVTGGAGGIGSSVARRLAAKGYRVAIADLPTSTGDRLAEEIGGIFVPTDVGLLADLESAAATAVDRFGRLDVVHLNAGIASTCQFGDGFDADSYRETMRVNVDGTIFGVQAALPYLRRGGGGVIMVTGSLAGLVASAYSPVYAMSKHAVIGLVRCLGPALEADGIRIHAICPTFVDTPFIDDARDDLLRLGRPILPTARVADAVESVLTETSTGQAWIVRPDIELQLFGFADLPPIGQVATAES